jgi:hypothetical protein
MSLRRQSESPKAAARRRVRDQRQRRLAAVEVSGADTPQALMQSTSADLASGSPSAAVLVFGLRAARSNAFWLPRPRRVAVARDAAHLARRGLTNLTAGTGAHLKEYQAGAKGR